MTDCNHSWVHLRTIPQGHQKPERIKGVNKQVNVWYFDHLDDVFYCSRCLEYEVRSFDPLTTKSIYSHNIKTRPNPSQVWK